MEPAGAAGGTLLHALHRQADVANYDKQPKRAGASPARHIHQGGTMMRRTTRILAATAVVAAFAVTSAQAQNVRVRGAIENVTGNVVTVKSRDGETLKLTLKDNANIRGVVKASLADVKASYNVAITSRPRADGSLEAV